jgi:hypothetical protein
MDASGFRRCKCGARKLAVILAASLALSGCDPLSISLLGAGASAGITSQLSGVNYRTFADSLTHVKQATLAAMEKMKIKVLGIDKTETGETIRAKTNDRTIEIELETLTASATRVRAVARRSDFFLVDSATSAEILQQTAKAL